MRERGAEELAELRKNSLFQLSMLNRIPKPSVSLLEPKGCKNDACDDISTCRGEGGGRKRGIIEEKWLASATLFNKITKPSESILQPKGLKNDSHHDTLSCRGEGGEGGGAEEKRRN